MVDRLGSWPEENIPATGVAHRLSRVRQSSASPIQADVILVEEVVTGPLGKSHTITYVAANDVCRSFFRESDEVVVSSIRDQNAAQPVG